MTEQIFKPGDVVMMKMGGPHMTVERVAANGVVYCVWFSRGRKLCRDGFDGFALKPVVTFP